MGPLPPLHRAVVSALTLVVCAGLGLWLRLAFGLPAPGSGAVIGVVVGLLALALLLRDDRSHPAGRPR